ncbi:hypothetical protein CsatB_018947 [Cannabis sativa]
MVQTRRGLSDPANSQTLDSTLQDPQSLRVPPAANPGQMGSVVNGGTTPVTETAPGVQETGNNGSAHSQDVHNMTVLLGFMP